MSMVTNAKILEIANKNIRALLQANVGTIIIDPKKAERKSNQDLVRLNFPRSTLYYPHIVCGTSLSEDTLSIKGDSTRVSIICTITVVADNTKDLDNLMDAVNLVMRISRLALKAYGMNRPKDYNLGIDGIQRMGNIVQRAASYRLIYYAME